MNSSFYNGVSGLKTHQYGMDVWADNISNINTNGYKGSTPEFSNVFSKTLANSYLTPANSQSGEGAMTQTTALDMSQGALVDSDNPFDMALEDEGWFGTRDQNGNTFYTREGDFTLDADKNLVTRSGNFVLGSSAGNIATDGTVSIANTVALGEVASQGKIQLPENLTMPATPTTYVNFKGNLDPNITSDYDDVTLSDSNYTSTVDTANKTISIDGNTNNVTNLQNPKSGDSVFVTITDANGTSKTITTTLDDDLKWSVNALDIGNLDTSEDVTVSAVVRSMQEIAGKSSFHTEVIMDDGSENDLFINFEKIVPQTGTSVSWNATATLKDSDGNTVATNDGVFTFNENGALTSNTLTEINGITLGFGTPYDSSVSNTGYDGVTGLSTGSYGATTIDKDGYEEGKLTNYALSDDGEIKAYFDNSKDVTVAKVAVYHFQNDQGLSHEGGNYFSQTSNSGKAIFYTDSDGNTINGTTIKGSKLEASNVKLSTALTEIIVMQKAYEASSKSITTSDELLQNAIQMKK